MRRAVTGASHTDASTLRTAPYGFSIFKPSTLWPPPPPEFRKRAAESTSLPGLKEAARKFQQGSSPSSSSTGANPTVGSAERHGHRFGSLATHNKAHALADAVEKLPEDDPQRAEREGAGGQGTGPKTSTDGEQNKAELARVIKVKVDGEEVELSDQIQLYATNEQVCPFLGSAPLARSLTLSTTQAQLSVCQPHLAAEPRRTAAPLRPGRRQGGLSLIHI